jgi:hypothetical protein
MFLCFESAQLKKHIDTYQKKNKHEIFNSPMKLKDNRYMAVLERYRDRP